jgi:hypothetical protein
MAFTGDTVTATVVRRPGRDAFGDTRLGEETRFTVDGCLFAPGSSSETTFQAEHVDTTAQLYVPADAPTILPTDRITVRGATYSVVGDVADWGPAFGFVVGLRRVTG